MVRFILPEIAISSPAPQTLTAAPTAQVSGTVSAGVTAVEVNDVAAALAGTAFIASVPLFEGNNLLTAVATRRRRPHRHGERAGDPRLDRAAGGDPRPRRRLHHHRRDGRGLRHGQRPHRRQPRPGGGRGHGQRRRRRGGEPQLRGRRRAAALGDNTLTATARDLSGNVASISVTVRRDAPAGPRIAALAGDLQDGAVGSALAQPLVVAVTDGAGAPLAGRQVTFRVVENNGTVENLAGAGPRCSS